MTGGLCTKCGHGKSDHEPLDPQCSAPRCTCLKYRPAPPAPLHVANTPQPVAPIPGNLSTPAVRRVDAPEPPQPGMSIDNLAQACLRSENKRTQAMGPKLLDLAEKARAALRKEREAAEAKAKASEEFAAKKAAVDRLAKQLAAAKAELRKVKPAGTPAPSAGEFLCDECGQSFGTPQGRGAHAFRAHGRRKAADA